MHRLVQDSLHCLRQPRSLFGSLYRWRHLSPPPLSSSTRQNDGTSPSDEPHPRDNDATPLPSSSFNIVAADAASHRPTRRFNVSTGGTGKNREEGGQPKVQVFRDLTRNRDPSWERVMEHTTFVSHLPKQLQQYEAEQVNNPLVRDQSRLIIRKDDPANRQWLSLPEFDGGDADGHSTASYFEREVAARKARLNRAERAVFRRRVRREEGAEGGTEGTPEEGMCVEEKIQLAMAQGDFDDLKGKGKPLERLEGHLYATDKTSATYMDVLSKSGVKPVWVERSSRIREAERRLVHRLEAEWAKVVLETWEQGERKEKRGKEGAVARWKSRVVGLAGLREDVAWINAEIDLYNLQVPSMSLQRMRMTLEEVCDVVQGGEKEGGTWMERGTARAVVRAAEKEGVFSTVTALGSLRLDAEEMKKGRGQRSRREEENVGRSASPENGGKGWGKEGEHKGSLLDSLASWLSRGARTGPGRM